MITSDIIVKYTDGLYSSPEHISPKYTEFRDMFSSGQLRSKEWLVTELNKIIGQDTEKTLAIVGAWYGTLGILLKAAMPALDITLIDIDPRCEQFINCMIYGDNSIRATTHDMYMYQYAEDIIVNTSCEHIPDLTHWLSLIPARKMVVLQSNNYYAAPEHINCVDSTDMFIKQSGLTNIVFNGQLVMPMYTRYMIIGYT